MPIVFDRLHHHLKKKGTTLYKLKADKKIGGKTLDVLMGRIDASITTSTIAALCEVLDCQPGDIMEYKRDD